jgi:hypothetical protein
MLFDSGANSAVALARRIAKTPMTVMQYPAL